MARLVSIGPVLGEYLQTALGQARGIFLSSSEGCAVLQRLGPLLRHVSDTGQPASIVLADPDFRLLVAAAQKCAQYATATNLEALAVALSQFYNSPEGQSSADAAAPPPPVPGSGARAFVGGGVQSRLPVSLPAPLAPPAASSPVLLPDVDAGVSNAKLAAMAASRLPAAWEPTEVPAQFAEGLILSEGVLAVAASESGPPPAASPVVPGPKLADHETDQAKFKSELRNAASLLATNTPAEWAVSESALEQSRELAYLVTVSNDKRETYCDLLLELEALSEGELRPETRRRADQVLNLMATIHAELLQWSGEIKKRLEELHVPIPPTDRPPADGAGGDLPSPRESMRISGGDVAHLDVAELDNPAALGPSAADVAPDTAREGPPPAVVPSAGPPPPIAPQAGLSGAPQVVTSGPGARSSVVPVATPPGAVLAVQAGQRKG